jgi:hypothetical protein
MKQQPTSGNSATSPRNHPTPDKDFLTSQELATVLRISIRTVRRWEIEGMPAHRRHRTVRYPLPQIREWMKATDRA